MEKERSRSRRAIWPAILCLALAAGVSIRGEIGREAAEVQGNRLRKLSLAGFYDPDRGFLDATARLTFAAPAASRRLWLDEGLKLKSVRDDSGEVSGVVSEYGELVAPGSASSILEIGYSGRLKPQPDPFADPGSPLRPGQVVDPFSILSYVRDFYPHPGLDFTEARMDMRLPAGWNCLGSGTLRAQSNENGGTIFRLDNPLAKGMALVCGRFRRIADIPAPLPVTLYGWPGLDLKRYCRNGEIGRILRFYRERLGPLDVGELNILLRRSQKPGGLSYSGLVVLGVVAAGRRGNRLESPLALCADGSDILAHELAHQWWGGIVSWRTAADSWITEGLATYCSLAFLRGEMSAREHARLRARLARWVANCARRCKAGKCNAADPEIHQALAYAKPALMLSTLAEALGQEELFRRLSSILEARRGSNLGGGEFLDLLAAGNGTMRGWMASWMDGNEMNKWQAASE